MEDVAGLGSISSGGFLLDRVRVTTNTLDCAAMFRWSWISEQWLSLGFWDAMDRQEDVVEGILGSLYALLPSGNFYGAHTGLWES